MIDFQVILFFVAQAIFHPPMDFQFVLSAEHTNRHFYGRFKTKFPTSAILNILCTQQREPSLNKTKKRGGVFFIRSNSARRAEKKSTKGTAGGLSLSAR
jgi:hypothetical protein